MTKEEIAAGFRDLQLSIIRGLEASDGVGTFEFDHWERKEGGGGRTAVIQNGRILEKGGVNFSAVEGPLHPNVARSLQVEADRFFATGVSIVLHPHNPWVPIIHMNVRYFETGNDTYWFGGGIDLTPIYIDDKQAREFHLGLKAACDKTDPEYYREFKGWADRYFFIPHRNETRGIGGIFFDRLNHGSRGYSKAQLWDFVMEVGNTFLKVYQPLMAENASKAYSDAEKQWQLLRRGRYVEFNLVYDKGTRFGLETGGRIESILMSLPMYASWQYNWKAEEGSAEATTLSKLRQGIDWLA